MQNLTLQMAKAAPIRQQMSSQDNAANSGSDNVVSTAPNAFAEMLKKQVKQKEAKANDVQDPQPKAKENANQATKTGSDVTSKASNEVMAKEATDNEKVKTEESVEVTPAPIQDVMLMQMGLQTATQINPNKTASTVDETGVDDETDGLISMQNTGNEKNVSSLASPMMPNSGKETNVAKPVASPSTFAAGDARASATTVEDEAVSKQVTNDISVKKEWVQTPGLAAEANGKELELKSAQTQLNMAAIAQQAPTKVQETTVAASIMAANEIPTAFGKPEWSQAVNQKVVWMVGKGEQSATLTLNPPDMGPLKVVIQVENDQVDTTFISDNPEVRQALQDGMQMLRDKMQDTGMQLGNAQVSSQAQSQRHFEQAMQQRAQQRLEQTTAGAVPDDAAVSQTVTQRVSNGLVDTFA